MLKVPKFFKEEKTASNKKSRRITIARCLTSDEVIQMIEEKKTRKGAEKNRKRKPKTVARVQNGGKVEANKFSVVKKG